MSDIQTLLEKRQQFRKEKKFEQADSIRRNLEALGYNIVDELHKTNASILHKEISQKSKQYLALFGSGETSSVGRSVYDYVLKQRNKKTVKIAIVTTPAGFQPNVQIVHEEIADFIRVGLSNYHPEVSIVYANTKDHANDPSIVEKLNDTDILFMGPGSPTYAVTVLRNSLLYKKISHLISQGTSLFLSSAAVLACSRFVLPVYEIFKVGEPLHWKKGLDLLSKISSETTCIPHWNNNEGTPKIDTSCCYMGIQRFNKLKMLLPVDEPLCSIDEQTAVLIDLQTKEKITIGKGTTHAL